MSTLKFNIIQDTREQTPWNFTDKCVGEVIVDKLDYGDYAIEGYEDLVWIERKASPSELAKNMFEERFEKLLNNIQNYPHKYIVCEFSMDDLYNYPYKSGLPKSVIRKIKIRGKMIMSYLASISLEYKINVVYAYNAHHAQLYTTSIMKNMLRLLNKDNN